MQIDIVSLPQKLTEHHLRNRAVVVFDVLRATTTIVTAIESGAKEVRVFGSLETAALAASEFDGPKLLAGESKCLPPVGFDLGNSPGDFTAARIAGKTIFLSTTNGTRAIVAAAGAARLFAAAAINATAMGRFLIGLGMDVTLVCAGTDGAEAPEDLRGAKLVEQAITIRLANLQKLEEILSPSPNGLHRQFQNTQGGRNIIDAGLEDDLRFASMIDQFQTIVEVTGLPPIARRNTGF